MPLSTTHRPNVVPYWNEVKNLSKKDKIQLITLLSSSLLDVDEPEGQESASEHYALKTADSKQDVSDKNTQEQKLLSNLPSSWRKLYGSASSLNNCKDPDDERFNYLMEKYK